MRHWRGTRMGFLKETEYPKIETLWKRDDRFKVIPGEYKLPEFGIPHSWMITEKIHGTNTRVIMTKGGKIIFTGRTEDASMSTYQWITLEEMFPQEKVQAAFEQEEDGTYPVIVLYGETYGPKIMKGGGNYRGDTSFRLFDVRVGEWWLNWENVEDVAKKLGISTVPVLWEDSDYEPTCRDELLDMFQCAARRSVVAREDGGKADHMPEGIVARTNPLLFTRKGERLMWKLKVKDFA